MSTHRACKSGRKFRIGDCFDIPLMNGDHACGRYLYEHAVMGHLVEVFDCLSQTDINVDWLPTLSRMFPPVFTDIPAAVTVAGWCRIGNIPVTDFQFPTFITSLQDDLRIEAAPYQDWYYRYADHSEFAGQLPPAKLRLERWWTWAPAILEHRIRTGNNPLETRVFPGQLGEESISFPRGQEGTVRRALRATHLSLCVPFPVEPYGNSVERKVIAAELEPGLVRAAHHPGVGVFMGNEYGGRIYRAIFAIGSVKKLRHAVVRAVKPFKEQFPEMYLSWERDGTEIRRQSF